MACECRKSDNSGSSGEDTLNLGSSWGREGRQCPPSLRGPPGAFLKVDNAPNCYTHLNLACAGARHPLVEDSNFDRCSYPN